MEKQVNINELLITKRLSKPPSQYLHNVFQAIAAKQLEKAGFEAHPGQTVQYLVTDARNRRVERRALAAPLLTPHTKPDAREYLNMLISAAETLLGVFGYAKDKIRDEALVYEKQLELSR